MQKFIVMVFIFLSRNGNMLCVCENFDVDIRLCLSNHVVA